MKHSRQNYVMRVGKSTLLFLSAAMLTFVACDQKTVDDIGSGTKKVMEKIGEGTKKGVEKIGEGKDKLESKMYERALQKAINEINKEFPKYYEAGVQLEKLTLDDKYVNVNVSVTENQLITVPLVADRVRENRSQLISKVNDMLNSFDLNDYTNDMGINGDFADAKALLSYLLKKTNRQIAVCMYGSINTEKVIVTTISPEELK